MIIGSSHWRLIFVLLPFAKIRLLLHLFLYNDDDYDDDDYYDNDSNNDNIDDNNNDYNDDNDNNDTY